VDAAHGIFRIVNANMANAIRRVSSEAGFDPRDFCMVVYGGNGPLHAAKQAEDLGIRKLLVPKTSPAFSALGLLLADYGVDTQRSYISPSGRAEVDQINRLLAELEDDAARELRSAGIGPEDLLFQRFLAICYPGQTFDMPVPALTSGGRLSDADLRATVLRFHDLHEELHAYAVRDEEPVIRAVRVQTIGRTAKPEHRDAERVHTPVSLALRTRRSAFFDGRFVDTPVYDGESVGHGHQIDGPAIVEERFTTIVVYPGWTAELDRHGNYVVTRD
jgi:N-methylhydantoinase A